jgi:hypothetical protein
MCKLYIESHWVGESFRRTALKLSNLGRYAGALIELVGVALMRAAAAGI